MDEIKTSIAFFLLIFTFWFFTGKGCSCSDTPADRALDAIVAPN